MENSPSSPRSFETRNKYGVVGVAVGTDGLDFDQSQMNINSESSSEPILEEE